MRQLANHLSKEQALAKLAAETEARQTLSFYRYVDIANPDELRDPLFIAWSELNVLGRVYLAHEGINAQISLPKSQLPAFRALLDTSPLFQNVPFKLALEEPTVSFWKLIIKVRKQIVAGNLPVGSYDIRNTGQHLSAKDFNAAIEQGAIVVDMRNRYESLIGKFTEAITPESQTFSDEIREVESLLADKKDQKILLYCTGGIRCEPASAYLKQRGFKDVNQLYGGVINYKHEIDAQGLESKFIGKNFVFDNRMAEKVTDDILGQCHTCAQPADTYDNCSSDLCHALFIQCADCKTNMLGACSDKCKDFAALPLEDRVRLRKKRKAEFKVLAK
jgi:UPF0176 protein